MSQESLVSRNSRHGAQKTPRDPAVSSGCQCPCVRHVSEKMVQCTPPNDTPPPSNHHGTADEDMRTELRNYLVGCVAGGTPVSTTAMVYGCTTLFVCDSGATSSCMKSRQRRCMRLTCKRGSSLRGHDDGSGRVERTIHGKWQ